MKGMLMVQGTASSVGKSLLCAAFCRILKQDGFSAAPFKAQNMALNSFVAAGGLEMGRAQVMQAEAAGLEPQVEMNPVLLKPTSGHGSQVIVMGRAAGNMEAMDYERWKRRLFPVIETAFNKLYHDHDVVVIEGAGSPAEINLKETDLVNMGLALRLEAPVLLVGDIDRGGVFASLYGTVALLQPGERKLLKGMIINRFRGDPGVLEPGLRRLEKLIGIPVIGVVPYIRLNLDDEDSLTERFNKRPAEKGLKVQVVLLPHISNFTDFNPLELYDDVSLGYIREPEEIESPDLLILPGSKNVIEDLLRLRRAGWTKPLRSHIENGGLLMGICGGFQMLGKRISDPDRVENSCPEVPGFGFLEMETVMEREKSTRQVEAVWCYRDGGYFSAMDEEELTGYEINTGRTVYGAVDHPVYIRTTGRWEGAVGAGGRVFGTYLHGIFDNLSWTDRLLSVLRRRRGMQEKDAFSIGTYREFKENEYNRLAAAVRENLDMERVYRIIERGG